MDLREILADTIGTGEIVRVRYHGGTQAGRVRDLQVHSVDGDIVKAVCLESHRFKAFRIDRMELAPDAPLDYDRQAAKGQGGLKMRQLWPSARRSKRPAMEGPPTVRPARPGLFARLFGWFRRAA